VPRVWVSKSASYSQTWGGGGSCFSSASLCYSRYSTPQEAVKGEIMRSRNQMLDTKCLVVNFKKYYIVKIHYMWNTTLPAVIKWPKLRGLIHSFLTAVWTARPAHIIYIYLVTINNIGKKLNFLLVSHWTAAASTTTTITTTTTNNTTT